MHRLIPGRSEGRQRKKQEDPKKEDEDQHFLDSEEGKGNVKRSGRCFKNWKRAVGCGTRFPSQENFLLTRERGHAKGTKGKTRMFRFTRT